MKTQHTHIIYNWYFFLSETVINHIIFLVTLYLQLLSRLNDAFFLVSLYLHCDFKGYHEYLNAIKRRIEIYAL